MPKFRNKVTALPQNTLRIFCEGEKTEPNYLNGFIDDMGRGANIRIKVQNSSKNTPIQLADEAIKFKKSADFIYGDKIWIVYDRESVVKYSDDLHARALDRARANGIDVAINNVCFEFWILIHLVDTSAPFSCFEDLYRASCLSDHLENYCGKRYKKEDKNVYRLVRSLTRIARDRARKINKSGVVSSAPGRSQPFHINPFVGIVDLIDAMEAHV